MWWTLSLTSWLDHNHGRPSPCFQGVSSLEARKLTGFDGGSWYITHFSTPNHISLCPAVFCYLTRTVLEFTILSWRMTSLLTMILLHSYNNPSSSSLLLPTANGEHHKGLSLPKPVMWSRLRMGKKSWFLLCVSHPLLTSSRCRCGGFISIAAHVGVLHALCLSIHICVCPSIHVSVSLSFHLFCCCVSESCGVNSSFLQIQCCCWL